MPDSRTQRGPHPKDPKSFAPEALPVLRQATGELSWLLSRGYSHKAALELVGNRHSLRVRQRNALQRCAASDPARSLRASKEVAPGMARAEPILIDGYNVLLTVEAAMSGGVVLVARDGAYRDLAALSRHYRKVATTRPALAAIGGWLGEWGLGPVTWLFDRPISNSGRLAAIVREVAREHGWAWQVELVSNPDYRLKRTTALIATADSAILDRCDRWLNLARHVIDAAAPATWLVDLSHDP